MCSEISAPCRVCGLPNYDPKRNVCGRCYEVLKYLDQSPSEVKRVVRDGYTFTTQGGYTYVEPIEKGENMNIPTPLDDRVIIDPVQPPDKTEGGLHIPDVAKKTVLKGIVVAVGPGRMMELSEFPKVAPHAHLSDLKANWPRYPMTVKKGDVVHYTPYAGHEIEVEKGKKLLVCKEDEILAVEG